MLVRRCPQPLNRARTCAAFPWCMSVTEATWVVRAVHHKIYHVLKSTKVPSISMCVAVTTGIGVVGLAAAEQDAVILVVMA